MTTTEDDQHDEKRVDPLALLGRGLGIIKDDKEDRR